MRRALISPVLASVSLSSPHRLPSPLEPQPTRTRALSDQLPAAAMGKGVSSKTTQAQVLEALRSLPQSVADTVEEEGGCMDKVASAVEAALRQVDPTGTVKPHALQAGLEEWDAKNSNKFSESWEQKEKNKKNKSGKTWAQHAHERVREELVRVNKVKRSQAARDKAKDATSNAAAPQPAMKRPAGAPIPEKDPWGLQ